MPYKGNGSEHFFRVSADYWETESFSHKNAPRLGDCLKYWDGPRCCRFWPWPRRGAQRRYPPAIVAKLATPASGKSDATRRKLGRSVCPAMAGSLVTAPSKGICLARSLPSAPSASTRDPIPVFEQPPKQRSCTRQNGRPEERPLCFPSSASRGPGRFAGKSSGQRVR